MFNPTATELADEVAKLSRRLQRERKTRLAAEQIAETGLRELYEKQQQLQVLEKIAAAANQTALVADALQFAIATICQYTGWMVGHAYLCEQEAPGTRLYPSSIWYLAKPERLQAFRDLTEKTELEFGVGLPGRVLATGTSAWIVDVSEDDNFPRAQVARLAGIRAGLAFPVLVGSDVTAVLEFFTDKAVEPDEPLLRLMSQIGTQLGRCVERDRAESRLSGAQLQLLPLGIAGSRCAPYAPCGSRPGPVEPWVIGWRGPHEAQGGLSRLLSQRSGREQARAARNVMKRVGQLWCCCNTLTILKESLTVERIAWFATQRIQRIGGLPWASLV